LAVLAVAIGMPILNELTAGDSSKFSLV